jgi:hypothetical protein
MNDLQIQCDCANVKGRVKNASPKSGNHIICYCKDCQAFAQFLDKIDSVLDANGGSEIFQTPQASIEITHGQEHIKCIRLSEKGLNRWYAECCKTPIANTMGSGAPFAGLLTYSVKTDPDLLAKTGPIKGYFFTKSAKGSLPDTIRKTGAPFTMLIKLLSYMIVWKAKGLNKPSSFFDADGKPVATATLYDATA